MNIVETRAYIDGRSGIDLSMCPAYTGQSSAGGNLHVAMDTVIYGRAPGNL